MRQKWKIGLSLLLAASMVPGSVPVVGQVTAQKAVAGIVKKEATADKAVKSTQKCTLANTTAKEKYAEGQAIILYSKAESTAAKAAVKSFGDDIEIVHTYDFDFENSSVRTGSTNKESGISVSLVESDTYSTEELVENLNKRSDIKYAQPNYKIKASSVGSDTYKEFQWSLDNFGQNGGTAGADINADELLSAETDGEERVIALVDTGIDYTHEDLAAAVWTNPIQSKQLKGEHGYDFINYDEDPMDDNGHGTHCSGIMAASVGNDTGIAGVANNDNVKIMALKILDSTGSGYGYEAIGAYNYIYKAQQLGVNVVAINNSWGMYEEDYILDELINLVGENGAISVCAAGNDGADNDEFGSWPANSESPYVISVAASTENDELAPFSSYGMNTVDIAAPGTGILSSVSYNCFNPSLYENLDELCSVMHNFSEVNLVKTLDDNGYIDTTVTDTDLEYGITTWGGEAEISLALSDESYYGVNEGDNKSLEWTLKGATAGEIYYLYFPYTATEAGDVYSSMMIKSNGPDGEFIYDPFWEEYYSAASAVYVCDGPLDDDGVYDEWEEYVYYGLTVGEAEYWGQGTGVAYDVSAGDKRAVTVQLYVGMDGDYTINIDDFAMAKNGVDEEAFGKYAFYDGTSMATPHVTGAVAAVAGAYSDESALEIKARILGCTRTSESLQGKVGTGGVLDLSKVDSPNMSIESVYMDEDGLVYIDGYYLDDVIVLVNGDAVSILDSTSDSIVIDGSDYANRSVEIMLIKDDYILTYPKFFAKGESFEYGMGFGGLLDGGNVTSAGRTMYYVDQYGYVYRGTPAQEEGMKTLEWESLYGGYDPYVFGEEYSYTVDYTMINETEAIYANNSLWSVVTLNVGYSEETALLMFDEEYGSWSVVDSLPIEMEEVEGYSITAYNGDVYLLGGYDNTAHTYSTKVFKYNAEDMIWEEAAEMPEGRVYAKALQVDDKLVVTLGGNSENNICKNMIFDGEAWTVSEADMGTVYGTEIYVLDEGTEYEAYVNVATAQIGIVDDGIVYTDIGMEGMGDTFIYSVSEDTYAGTGYILDRDSLYCDELYATTVQDDLYVIFGFGAEDYFEDWIMAKNKALSDEGYYEDDYYEDDYYEDEEYWDGYIELVSMPVETGFGNVIDESEEGVYVTGGEYYVPGDTITISAVAERDYFVKGLTVNGQKVNKKNGVYAYTMKKVTDREIVAAAQAGAYVTEINLPETMTAEQGKTVQLVAEVLPENAENKKIIWYCESEDVTVDIDGNVSVSADAAPGTEVVVYASSQDREYPLAECVIVIKASQVVEETTTKAEETTKAEDTTTKVEETTKEEESKVPAVNSKVTVGKNVYKVVTNSEHSKTVAVVSLKNKKAKKATVPATIKIDGVTYKVTEIAANAFKNSKNLKSVKIGRNVTSIGKNAFRGCKKLRKITIKSTKLKAVKKAALRGTSKKLVVKAPKKSKKQYKKLFKKVGFKGTVKS